MHMFGMENMDSDLPRVPLLCHEDLYNYIHDTAKNILDRYVKISAGKLILNLQSARSLPQLNKTL